MDFLRIEKYHVGRLPHGSDYRPARSPGEHQVKVGPQRERIEDRRIVGRFDQRQVMQKSPKRGFNQPLRRKAQGRALLRQVVGERSTQAYATFVALGRSQPGGSVVEDDAKPVFIFSGKFPDLQNPRFGARFPILRLSTAASHKILPSARSVDKRSTRGSEPPCAS